MENITMLRFVKKRASLLILVFVFVLFSVIAFTPNTNTDITTQPTVHMQKTSLEYVTTTTKRSSRRKKSSLSKKKCKSKRNVLFLKTHKTGSSTVQNIFLRYGDRRNLTFVLPRRHNYFGHPKRFERSMLDPTQNRSNNIFTHHARLNYEEMQAIMPANTTFVTILREPVSLTESLFSYYNLKRFFRENSSMHFLETFFSTTPNMSAYHALSSKRLWSKFGRNQMSFDLGLEVDHFDNLETIEQFIKYIDDRFHLVMIADRMEESLVLLRHLLCWSIGDVVAFRHNARHGSGMTNLTDDLKQKIRLFNTADELLYEHFSAKLTRLTEAFGREKMAREIVALRNATTRMFRKCVSKQVHSKMVVRYQHNRKMTKLCQDFVISELPYTELLRQKQNGRIPNNQTDRFRTPANKTMPIVRSDSLAQK